MRARWRKVGPPLLGVVTSVIAEAIQGLFLSDSRNARGESGGQKPRYGWRSLRALQTGFSASYGLHYCQGLSSAGAVSKEYVSFETLSGTTKPYSRHVTTLAPTVLTDGVSALSLNAGRWGCVVFDDYALFFNPSDTAYPLAKHTIGTNDSFTAIKPPAAPTDPLTVAFIKNLSNGSESSYRTMGFSGVSAANDVTLSGDASGGSPVKSISGSSIRVQLGASQTGSLRVYVELDGATGPGQQDWSKNDVFKCGVSVVNGASVPLRFDPAQIVIGSVNNGGTDFPFEVSVIEVEEWAFQLVLKYNPGAARASRDDIDDIYFDLYITASSGTSANNVLELTTWTIGGVDPEVLPKGGQGKVAFYGGYKNSTTGQESPLGPPVEVTESQWRGELAGVVDGKEVWFGTVPRVTAVGSSETGVDKWVLRSLYSGMASLEGQDIRVHGEYTDSGGTLVQDVTTSVGEWLQLDEHLASTAPSIDSSNIKCACAHNGGVGWGMGNGDIEFSYVGQPLRLFSDYDTATPDDAVGNRLPMSPDGNDRPVACFSAGGAFIAVGSLGCYVTSGPFPSAYLPFARVADAGGIAGPYAGCEWRDDSGAPGAAWLGTNLDTVWFLRVLNARDQESGYELVEASFDVRGKVKDWLFEGAAPTTDDIFVGVDERGDALWIEYHKRGCVFRRANVLSGKRPWEFYDYTVTGHWKERAYSGEYGLRRLRSTGEVDEAEYDSSAVYAPIEGTDRDGGSAMPAVTLTTKAWNEARRRIVRARLLRQTLTDQPTVALVLEGSAQTGVQVASGEHYVNFPATAAKGRDVKYQVTLPEGSGLFYGLEAQEAELDQRLHA